MSLVKIDWKPSSLSLRRFGVVVITGLCVVSAVLHLYFEQTTASVSVAIAGAILGLPALLGMKIALPGYWLWMGLAFVIGNISGRIMLAAVYYVVLTPIGLLMRLLGHDRLALKKKPVSSFWQTINVSPSDSQRYERQF